MITSFNMCLQILIDVNPISHQLACALPQGVTDVIDWRKRSFGATQLCHRSVLPRMTHEGDSVMGS